MKLFLKMMLLFLTFSLGGYAGVWVTPHDISGDAATLGSIFVITVGALAGLFVGGMIVLLWD